MGEACILADKKIYEMVNFTINKSIKSIDSHALFEFKKNADGEILLSEYNTNELYKLMNIFNRNINLEKKDYIIFLPAGLASNKILINGWGSKIPIRIMLSRNFYTNIKTKVTNYGINNALVEVYFVVDVNQQVISPFKKRVLKRKYEILVSNYFINGKVPNFYGKSFVTSSNIFDIYLKI